MLAAVSPESSAAFETAAVAARVPVREIGHVIESPRRLEVLGLDGVPARFARGSYSHF